MSSDQLTEDALALAFAERHEGKITFVEELSSRVAHRWLIRDGDGTWQPDRTLRIQWLIRQICAGLAADVSDPDTILRLGSRATFVAVELIAHSDPRLARTREQIGIKPKPRKKKVAADEEGIG
jgi:hypothetical protein